MGFGLRMRDFFIIGCLKDYTGTATETDSTLEQFLFNCGSISCEALPELVRAIEHSSTALTIWLILDYTLFQMPVIQDVCYSRWLLSRR